MHKPLLIAALAAIPLASPAAEQAAAPAKNQASQAAPVPQYSREKLDRIRQSLVSQIAVFDKSENAMRAPTAAEAAALALPADGSPDSTVALRGGGVALRADLSHASLLVVERSEDGKIAIRHDNARTIAAGGNAKGAAHVD